MHYTFPLFVRLAHHSSFLHTHSTIHFAQYRSNAKHFQQHHSNSPFQKNEIFHSDFIFERPHSISVHSHNKPLYLNFPKPQILPAHPAACMLYHSHNRTRVPPWHLFLMPYILFHQLCKQLPLPQRRHPKDKYFQHTTHHTQVFHYTFHVILHRWISGNVGLINRSCQSKSHTRPHSKVTFCCPHLLLNKIRSSHKIHTHHIPILTKDTSHLTTPSTGRRVHSTLKNPPASHLHRPFLPFLATLNCPNFHHHPWRQSLAKAPQARPVDSLRYSKTHLPRPPLVEGPTAEAAVVAAAEAEAAP